MQVGKDLDELIAEKFFGWGRVSGVRYFNHHSISLHTFSDDIHLVPPHIREYYIKYCKPLDGTHLDSPSVPQYSRNLNAAMEIVEKIPLRFCMIKESDNSKERKYKCYFTKEDGESGYPVSYSDSLPHAICLAALKVIG